jgi:uncharacterized protein YraI
MANKQENSSGNKNLVYIIVGVVVIIVLGLVLYYFLGTGSPDTDVADTDTGASTGGGATVADSAAEEGGATVEVEALSNINQRGGPGTDYGVVSSLPQGGTAIAVGRNADGSWILVQTESGDEVWMTASTDLVKANGDLMSLPVVSAAAPAYDAGNPMVNKVMNEIPLVVHHADTFTCASHGGLNSLLPEVASGNVMGPHSGDFIYNGNNVLFKKVNGSVVLINENPVARFEGDAETMPLARAMQLFANGEIIWNGTSGDWPARGVTGCDLLVRQ